MRLPSPTNFQIPTYTCTYFTLTGPTKKQKTKNEKRKYFHGRAADCFLPSLAIQLPITKYQIQEPKTADRRHDLHRFSFFPLHAAHAQIYTLHYITHYMIPTCPQVARAHALARARETSPGRFETGLHTHIQQGET